MVIIKKILIKKNKNVNEPFNVFIKGGGT